jgi:hypothetical protein
MDLSTIVEAARATAVNLTPVIVQGGAVLTGMAILLTAVHGLYANANPRTASQAPGYGGLFAKLLVGGLFLRMSATVGDFSQLLFGAGVQDIRGVMAYAPLPQEAGFWQEVFEVCLLWVVLIGWAGVFRGFLLWNKAANGNASGQGGDHFMQGMWHVIGGVSAVSMTSALQSFFGK